MHKLDNILKILTFNTSAINEINKSDAIKKEDRKNNIKRLFESWNESDDQQEQQENLEIIESMNSISI
ncbi:hypothetical protein PN497_02830 [Sphaerospermopsis kisseleviana CS-549]|uniref:Uncharacterized protein n=1 Tax=Sphaerospermopsis kisseleviana CS-549 TaxID=3021783 RepID=A0ABT4ZMK0_9CYAN|nr:hypothetical protein [Sphaerospermopsis kisseleviana]MDB9440319.1 hypothetical protein [Sphaerospermopsis kisseleviana CS-549]BAZ81184.1 hypothetical protein NIES73_24510 [Sphaerospermopsis kisseleviana NIES-73]